MFRRLLIIPCLLLAQFIAAVNESYYASLNGKKDAALREAITALAYSKHTKDVGYNWKFENIDIVNGVVLDIYSTCDWTPGPKSSGGDQCGTYGVICDCYNREHTVPQSFFNSQSPQVSDRHHLFLTDGKVNGVRSDYPFGETNANSLSSMTNGEKALGKFGKASSGYSGSVYEPDDQYKGDIARAVLYMAVRYATQNECCTNSSNSASNSYPVTAWGGGMFSGSLTTNYGLSNAAITFFLKWHRNDKVSSKEIARNTGVENLQGNRNPFVDYPILVEYLWGNKKGETFYLSNATGSFSSDFIPGVSDGSSGGVGPVIPTYSIEWMVQGTRVDLQQVDEGDTPTPPTVSNCSTSRVFVGWTANVDVTSQPTDLFTEAPQATKNATYYAVYADKDGAGGSTSTFTKATSLAIGDIVAIVCEKANMEMTGVPGTNKAELVGGLPAGAYLMEVVAGTGSTFAFKYGTQYLNCTGGGALSMSALVAENSSWTVTFSESNAKITNVGYPTRSIWWNYSSPRFGTYTATSANSSYYAVQLYKKTVTRGVTYSNYSLQCTAECTATLTILSDDENKGTVEFVDN